MRCQRGVICFCPDKTWLNWNCLFTKSLLKYAAVFCMIAHCRYAFHVSSGTALSKEFAVLKNVGLLQRMLSALFTFIEASMVLQSRPDVVLLKSATENLLYVFTGSLNSTRLI